MTIEFWLTSPVILAVLLCVLLAGICFLLCVACALWNEVIRGKKGERTLCDIIAEAVT